MRRKIWQVLVLVVDLSIRVKGLQVYRPERRLSARQIPDMSIKPMLRLVGESTRFSVASSVAVTLILRHDIATLQWVVGAVAASIANKGLKKIIKQSRPGSKQEDDGMPSSHACAMANLGTSVLTNVWLASSTPPWIPLDRAGVTICLVSYFLVSVTWRVVARYHTVPQIIVGTAFGISTSLLWRYGCSVSGASAYADALFETNDGSLFFLIASVLVTGAAVILSREGANFFASIFQNRHDDKQNI